MMDVNACIRVPLFKAISHVVKNTYGMGEDKESFSYLGVFGVLFCRGDEMSFVGRKRVYNFIYIHTYKYTYMGWYGSFACSL